MNRKQCIELAKRGIVTKQSSLVEKSPDHEVSSVSPADVNLRDEDQSRSRSSCAGCRYWLDGFCSVLTIDTRPDQNCDAFQGGVDLTGGKKYQEVFPENDEAFFNALRDVQPFMSRMIKPIFPPFGVLILYESGINTFYSLTWRETLDRLGREIF